MINLQALRDAELHTDPFDYLVVPGFLSPGILARVNADYPPIETAANHELENLQYGPAFARADGGAARPGFRHVTGRAFRHGAGVPAHHRIGAQIL